MNSQTSFLAYIQEMLGDDFNISLFMSIVRKSIIWTVLFILAGCAIVFLYQRYTLPDYEASSTLMLKRETTMKQEIFGGGSSVLASDYNEATREIRLMKSKYFVKRVITQLPFDVSYYKEGRTRLVSTELYTATPFVVEVIKIKDPVVYGKEIFVELLNEKSFILRYSIGDQAYREILSYNKFFETPLFEIKLSISPAKQSQIEFYGKVHFFVINDIDRYSENLIQNINVEPVSKTTKTFLITYRDKNPIKASALANALAKEFVIYDLERQAESADRVLNFIESELDSFMGDMQVYRDSMRMMRINKKFLDPEKEMSSLISAIRTIENKKSDILLNLKMIDWFKEYAGNMTDLQDVSPSLISGELKSVNSYINEIKNHEKRKENLLIELSPNHPQVLKIEDEVVRTKNEMYADLNNIVIQKNFTLDDLQAQYNEYFFRLLVLPEEQEEFQRFKTEYDEMSKYYRMLVTKQSDYKLAKAGIVPDYIVLSTASQPQKAVGIQPALLWGIAVAVGLILGVVLIALRYLLHNTIISIETVQKNTKAAMLGIVPSVFTEIPLTGIVVTQNPKSIISEAFRSLRNNLQFISNTPGPKTLAFTSTISGEGKTFISINMSAILSLLDKKVILLDVDMRRPRLSKIFNVENMAGMSTILIGRDNVDECIRKTELKNLDYITSGPIPPNPAELILSDRLNEMVEYLKTKYDYIIFDTPPIGLVTDGFEVMKRVDYPIYVLRAEYSAKSFISNLDKLMTDNKLTNLSVILNDVGRGVSGYYGGYGYKYGYSYGYMYAYRDSGYYSDDVNIKKSFLKRLFSKSS